MTHITVVHLSGLVLPETGPLRGHVRPPARRTALYEERYDRRTLLYDAVKLAEKDAVLLTGPRFLNLWPLLRDGLLRDGAPVARATLHRQRSLRFEQTRLDGTAAQLAINIDGTRLFLPVRQSAAPLLRGKRVLMAVNKNNPLVWIGDWARFHANRHGANGVLLFDNRSSDYRPEDLAAKLGTVPGIDAVVVVSAPFPYGPADKGGRFDVPPRFFQTAMFNLARRDFLAQAASVLSIDIDELIEGPDGTSIFAATETHPLGMITVPGSWVFPPPDTDGPATQHRHQWRAVPPQSCHPKWCIAPNRFMGRLTWNVHKLGGPLQPLFTMSRQFRLLHCRAASTGWKPGRFAPPAQVEHDPELAALFEKAF